MQGIFMGICSSQFIVELQLILVTINASSVGAPSG